MSHNADCDAHADCRKELAKAWSAYLEAAMNERLDDGTSVLELVFILNPSLRARLFAAVNRTRPTPPERTDDA